VGYFVPGQGLAGTLAMSNTGVAIDGGLQGKSVGDIGKAIVLNSAFTSMGYGVGEYISNLAKPYSRNIQQLDLMQIKHTMGKNHPYTMNHPTNFKYDYSISEIMGNTTGTGVTEYASQKANQFNNK
jgi:hypothetical protein